MKMKFSPPIFLPWVVAIVSLTFVTGCKKEAADPATSNPTPAAPMEATSATPVATPVPAAAPAVDSRFAESQAAINAGDYEKAATALIAVQQVPLTEQQAELAAKQMRQLQSALASAVAGGDPRAKAAADKLRRSTPR